MAAPRPYVATKTGAASAAPAGSVPIEIYGVSGGGAGGPVDIGDVTGLQAALNSKLDETTFDAYTASAETAFEGLERAVTTNTANLASTTATANSAEAAATAAQTAANGADTKAGNAQTTANAAKATADAALPKTDKRVPIVLTKAAYDALNPPVAGQVYYIQG